MKYWKDYLKPRYLLALITPSIMWLGAIWGNPFAMLAGVIAGALTVPIIGMLLYGFQCKGDPMRFPLYTYMAIFICLFRFMPVWTWRMHMIIGGLLFAWRFFSIICKDDTGEYPWARGEGNQTDDLTLIFK